MNVFYVSIVTRGALMLEIFIFLINVR